MRWNGFSFEYRFFPVEISAAGHGFEMRQHRVYPVARARNGAVDAFRKQAGSCRRRRRHRGPPRAMAPDSASKIRAAAVNL